MTALRRIVEPVAEPVSLAELKAYLKFDEDMVDDDAVLLANIIAMRRVAEDHLNRALITQTWRLSLDAAPGVEVDLWEGVRDGADIPALSGSITLPRPPLQSVSSVTTYDDSDNGTVFASSNYYVDTEGTPGRVVLRTSASWPTIDRVANGLVIDYVAGYGDDWNSVPMEIRIGIIELVRHVFDDCEGDVTMITPYNMPQKCVRLFSGHVVHRLMAGLGS